MKSLVTGRWSASRRDDVKRRRLFIQVRIQSNMLFSPKKQWIEMREKTSDISDNDKVFIPQLSAFPAKPFSCRFRRNKWFQTKSKRLILIASNRTLCLVCRCRSSSPCTQVELEVSVLETLPWRSRWCRTRRAWSFFIPRLQLNGPEATVRGRGTIMLSHYLACGSAHINRESRAAVYSVLTTQP